MPNDNKETPKQSETKPPAAPSEIPPDFSKFFEPARERAEASWGALKYYQEVTIPKIVRWVMQHSGGIVKSEKQASRLIYGFIILTITISAWLFIRGFWGGAQRTPTLEEMQREYPTGSIPERKF